MRCHRSDVETSCAASAQAGLALTHRPGTVVPASPVRCDEGLRALFGGAVRTQDRESLDRAGRLSAWRTSPGGHLKCRRRALLTRWQRWSPALR